MKTKKLLPPLIFVLTLFLPALVRAAQPPNVLFILADDLGWGDLGAFYQNSRAVAGVQGKPWERTPNLDRLAADGALLPDSYASAPVCAPSRASIILGLSQGHANVRDNQFDKGLEDNHTLPNVLKAAGYSTVIVGKWGLQGGKITHEEDTVAPGGEQGPNDWPAYPTRRGFDDFFGYVRHSDGHEHYPKEAPYTGQHKSKQVWDHEQNITPELDKCYTADLWTAWAKHWIVDHERTNAGHPFFMYLAYDTPHAATELPTQAYPAGGGLHGGLQWLGTPGHMINTASGRIDSWIHPDYQRATYHNDNNPSAPWPDVYKRYATSVRRLDSAVADLRALLADLHIADNTIVVFTSDNGPSIESYLPKKPLRANFFDSFGPFDGIKRDCWEGGVRVPVVIAWPGHIRPGTVDRQPSINYDWLPTFADAAGLPAPANADGISLVPELTGQTPERKRHDLYIEYYEKGRTPNYRVFAAAHRGRQRGQMQTIRIGDYVGVRYNIQSPSDPFEIYKVTTDTHEANNLAAAMPALQHQFQAIALQSRRPDSDARRPYDDQLVPRSTPGPTEAGVEWHTYAGPFPWVPAFETLKTVTSGTESTIDVPKHVQAGADGVFYTGYIKAPAGGNYTFYLTCDSGALLRIHDATVIDADYGYTGGKEISGSIRLQAGLHPFRLYYAHRNAGAPSLALSWSGPGVPRQAIPASALQVPNNAGIKAE